MRQAGRHARRVIRVAVGCRTVGRLRKHAWHSTVVACLVWWPSVSCWVVCAGAIFGGNRLQDSTLVTAVWCAHMQTGMETNENLDPPLTAADAHCNIHTCHETSWAGCSHPACLPQPLDQQHQPTWAGKALAAARPAQGLWCTSQPAAGGRANPACKGQTRS